jgi:type VI protein secretion system component VasA
MQALVGALKGVRCMPHVARLPVGKDPRTPIVFGRGLRVDLDFEDLGPRIFPMALVLERLLAGIASANSFTQVNWVCNQEKQEKWPPRAGLRKTL